MTRLTAAERRESLLECACGVFTERSYRAATTAEIARAAGVSEPILYRHFPSKRDLYLACLDRQWQRLRTGWDEAVEAEPDAARWFPAMAAAFFASHSPIASLWMQALTEAAVDDAIRSYLRQHLRAVHDHVAGVIRRAQAQGAVVAERDADAEAWIFISMGLFATIDRHLGGGVLGDDLRRVVVERRRWMTGRAEAAPA